MTISKVATYTTSDGKTFVHRHEAVKYEDNLTLVGIVSPEVQATLNAAGFVVVKKPIPRAKKAKAAPAAETKAA